MMQLISDKLLIRFNTLYYTVANLIGLIEPQYRKELYEFRGELEVARNKAMKEMPKNPDGDNLEGNKLRNQFKQELNHDYKMLIINELNNVLQKSRVLEE